MVSFVAVSWLVVMNILAMAAFVEDKHRSERGEWRISEANLLLIAMLGGWPGAKLAQHVIRHKTRKQPFRSRLNAVGLVPLTGMAALVAAHLAAPAEVAALNRSLAQFASAIAAGPALSDQPPLPRRFGPGSGD